MNKAEIRNELSNLEFEMAEKTKTLADEIRSGNTTREDAEKIMSELRSKKQIWKNRLHQWKLHWREPK